MPEGPEVKIFVDKLNQKYFNKTLLEVEVLSGRYVKNKIVDLNNIKNKKLKSVNCKGKFIWFDFEDNILFNTLGMTGNWGSQLVKHSRVKFTFKDNSLLYFNDIRNFGTIKVANNNDLVSKLKTLGPDMLSNPPNVTNFIKIMRKRNNKNICTVMMNQSVLSGIGNYIKAESLWFARINPHSTINNLTDENLVILYKAILFVINKSYISQGASIKDFYNFEGEKGSATEGFVVYGKSKDFNGDLVIKETTLDKRTTHWVKNRQVIGV